MPRLDASLHDALLMFFCEMITPKHVSSPACVCGRIAVLILVQAERDVSLRQADFTPYEGKSVMAAVVDGDAAAAPSHDADLALALQMQEVRSGCASSQHQSQNPVPRS